MHSKKSSWRVVKGDLPAAPSEDWMVPAERVAPAEARELYRLPDLDVGGSLRKPTITAADVQTVERTKRFRVADESFDKCDVKAPQALREDQYHGARSAATRFIARVPSPTSTKTPRHKKPVVPRAPSP